MCIDDDMLFTRHIVKILKRWRQLGKLAPQEGSSAKNKAYGKIFPALQRKLAKNYCQRVIWPEMVLFQRRRLSNNWLVLKNFQTFLTQPF